MGKLKLKTFYITAIILTALMAPRLPWYYFAALVVIFLPILFFACINLSWNFFIPVKCKAYTNEKIVALTFDDGPAAYTSHILDTLKQHNAPATFLCIGKNIAGNEQTLQRIKEEGHLIGNHSFSHHFWFDMWSAKKMMADMKSMNKEVDRAIGLEPLLFRPPYGVINPNLAAAIRRTKFTPIGWSIRSFDTSIKDKQKLLSRVLTRVKPGDIILLHDSMEITAAILPELIQQLTGKGYKIAPLDKMLNIDAYA